MPGSIIVGGARTPIGKLSGSLKSFTAVDLGGVAIAAALAKAGITGDKVDYMSMGHVIQAGAGQITARQAAVKGGIPMTVPALTVNKVCLSGLNATSTAGPSPWVIRSARPAPASRCISLSNCAAEAADSAPPHCAVAAGRARPCCSASMPDPAFHPTPKGSATWPTRLTTAR